MTLDQNQYKIVFFIENELWKKYLPSNTEIHLNKPVKVKRLLGRIVNSLSFKAANTYSKFFNRSILSINQSDCDLVIFPSQDNLGYQVQKPALSAVHDLMHRYEPHFEEYQGGEFEKRERHYTLLCEASKGLLVDSDMGKTHVIESYQTDPDKIFKLPFLPPYHLLELSEINVREKYNIRSHFIFYPAQFWEHKNHINLVAAFKRVIDRGIDLQLILVGSKKNNYQAVKEAISQHHLNDHVSILGYIPDQDLYSLYKNALFMIFPSLIGPTNIPPMEALLLECPLIVSNAYAMPEQVGEAALLIDPKSVEDMAEKMETLYADKALRQDLVEKGKKQISKWEHVHFNRRLKDIISALV